MITWESRKQRLGDLVPQEDNPRQIETVQADRLKKSWQDFGQVETLAVSPDGAIYNGHQRYFLLLEQFGPDYEVDVRMASRQLTRQEWQELTILLHDGTTGEWNLEVLSQWDLDLETLADMGLSQDALDALEADLALLGLTENEDGQAETRLDEAKKLQEKWGVQRGQVWQAGTHFVMCDDCRSEAAWDKIRSVAGVGKFQGIITSPPYAQQRKNQYGGVPADDYVEWWARVQELASTHLSKDGSFFVNIKPHCKDGERVLYVFDLVLAMQRLWDWRFVDEFCWMQPGMPGKWANRFKNEFEPVYHFCLQAQIKMRHDNVTHESDGYFEYRPETPSFSDTTGNIGFGTNQPERIEGVALPGNIIKAHRMPSESVDGQAAAFPVALPEFFMLAFSDPGDPWLDPFLGSGTTIVAAERTGRQGLGIEVLPAHVAVTLERLENLELEVSKACG